MKRKYYGWKRDSLDPRDLHFAKFMPEVKGPLPPHVDLGSMCSPVENQQDLGSCTANALAGATEFLELKQGEPFVDHSRLFIYYNERALEGTIKSDSGAQIRDGIKTLAKYGVCDEKLWPYVTSKFTRKPSVKCYNDAAHRKILNYYKIATLDGMRQCLAQGYPFVFGFVIFESFETIGANGIMPIPNVETEECLGGHAVMGVGYDDEKRFIKVRNSWGCEFGDAGNFYMPYEFIANKQMASDFWMITKEM